MEDRQVLDVVGAAAEFAVMEIRNHVSLAPDEFDRARANWCCITAYDFAVS